MRNKSIVFAVLVLFSCADPVRFEEPQPTRESNLRRVPGRLDGRYQSIDDSALLLVSDGLMVRYSVANFYDAVDSTQMENIKGDTAFSATEGNVIAHIVVKGDSTFQRWEFYDTLFDVARGDVLRRYKGYYFLNKRLSESSWQVMTLVRIDNGLAIGQISSTEDIDNLRAITETRSDTIFNFRPTKKQMKQYLKGKGFSDRDTFIKIE